MKIIPQLQLQNEEFVAIDIDSNDFSEPALTFENPMAMSHSETMTVPPPDISLPEDIEAGPPIMIFDDSEEVKQIRRKSATKSASPPAGIYIFSMINIR